MIVGQSLGVKFKGIDDALKNYAEIKKWRKKHMITVSTDHQQLNKFHDELIKQTVEVAMDYMQSELGHPPAPFAFFLMGSAGRSEQSVWSDQDHGIIYDGSSEDCQRYFLMLGSEISKGLFEIGYEYCDGKVMSSNPMWCQNLDNWKLQVKEWLDQASWESLRYFSTFFDSRVLIGNANFLNELKVFSFLTLEAQPKLYQRLVENVDFIKKGIGLFGQLLPETHGEYTGTIPLKQTTFFPYINALRLLALKEKILVPSTLTRFDEIVNHYPSLGIYKEDFVRLLDFRLRFCKDAKSYKEAHLMSINTLSKEEKQELKQLMKKGYRLFQDTKTIIEKECSTW